MTEAKRYKTGRIIVFLFSFLILFTLNKTKTEALDNIDVTSLRNGDILYAGDTLVKGQAHVHLGIFTYARYNTHMKVVNYPSEAYAIESINGIDKWRVTSIVCCNNSWIDIHLEAIIEECYKISFDSNGGTGTMGARELMARRCLTLPECSFTPPEGMVFDKWDINGRDYPTGEKIGINKDTVIKALYKKIPSHYNAILNTDNLIGASAKLSETSGLSNNSVVILTFSADEGFVFKDDPVIEVDGAEMIKNNIYEYKITNFTKDALITVKGQAVKVENSQSEDRQLISSKQKEIKTGDSSPELLVLMLAALVSMVVSIRK